MKENNLAGAMIYSLDLDDFGNTCGDGAFPLTSALSADLAEGGPVASDGQEPWGGDSGAVAFTSSLTIISVIISLNTRQCY